MYIISIYLHYKDASEEVELTRLDPCDYNEYPKDY